MPEDSTVPMMSFYMSRKRVHVGQLTPDDIHIEDIFHNLCILPRFAGNTSRPYSVGEHSLLVYQMVDDVLVQRAEAGDQLALEYGGDIAMQALMHDAAEYITGDIPAPVKYEVPEIREYEQKVVWPVICEKFGIEPVMNDMVKGADWVALFVEAHSLHCSDELEKWEHYDKYWPAAKAWMETYGMIEASQQPHPGMIMDALMTIYRELTGEIPKAEPGTLEIVT